MVVLLLMIGFALAGSDRLACPDREDAGYYFAAGTVDAGDTDRDTTYRDWYSRNLRSMGEPSLSCGPLESPNTYRFTWLRSFHSPIAVRVTWRGSAGVLNAVLLDGTGGSQPGKVKRRVQKAIGQKDWSRLRDGLVAAGFWRMPTIVKGDEIGLDGAEWLIEGRTAEGYHLVDRWSPTENDFRSAALRFIQLAGLTIGKDETY